jgi:hypothetical protein
MGYGDRTWCDHNSCLRWGIDCERSYTEEVHQRAIKWWGNENYRIVIYAGKPDCYEENKESQNPTG